ncbi:hypothetical protein [Sodalinema gerasimenkoae]|uniref:hypothetical protein n=1 Tax=Sodalinema gerasimenkoae TaxID=2862348 RepID=UPI001356ECD4|nr:hypothetical protein [Sodalinema gerasimenkoae]
MSNLTQGDANKLTSPKCFEGNQVYGDELIDRCLAIAGSPLTQGRVNKTQGGQLIN